MATPIGAHVLSSERIKKLSIFCRKLVLHSIDIAEAECIALALEDFYDDLRIGQIDL